ncbi:MAG: hypothetical protein LBJ90_02595 [Treponema sp.]|jgi:hypothetical protein|nr:hypothetical protein [Treponema sp.]
MKKFLIVFLFLITASFSFADSEEIDLYNYLYQGALTHEEQLSLLQTMAESKLTGAGDFYSRALHRLVIEYPNVSGATAREVADEQAIVLANLLGQEKYAAAGPDLWRAVDVFSNPLVKAEVLMALGKIQARAFLPQVIQVLQALNGSPAPDRLNGERVAFGAIVALEKYQDISGYLPVYFASTGWYSDRIKNQALNSLAVISSDPTQPMLEIINGSGYNYAVKLEALQSMEASGASNDSKSSVAAAALSEGWRASTTDARLRGQLNSMRKFAMRMIRSYGASGDSIYPLLERSYKQFADRNDGDRDEALDALNTLRTLASDESARRLSAFLMTINQKLQSGTLTRKDEDLVRAIIPALGAAGRPIGRPALNSVVALNWTAAVKALAQEALRDLQ